MTEPKLLFLALKKFLSEQVFNFSGNVNVVNLPETQKVEITNHQPQQDSVAINNLDGLILSIKENIDTVYNAIKDLPKPESNKSILDSLLSLKVSIDEKEIPTTDLGGIVQKLDDVISQIKDSKVNVDLEPITRITQKILEAVPSLDSLIEKNRVKVILSDEQLKKIGSSTAVQSGGTLSPNVARRLTDGVTSANDGDRDTLYTATYTDVNTSETQTANKVHVVGDGDKFVVSNAVEGASISQEDAIPIAGEDENGNKLNVSVQTRRQTPSGPAMNVQIGPGDIISNIPVFVDFEHHQVHEGESYLSQDLKASLGTNTVKYSITVPTFANTIQGPHMIFVCDIYNGSARIDLYETATFTGGSTMNIYNRNRNSATTAGTTLKSGVTSTNGTLIKTFFAGAGIKTSGVGRSESEMVLKSNTIYRVDVVGLVANTQSILGFLWYEDLGV